MHQPYARLDVPDNPRRTTDATPTPAPHTAPDAPADRHLPPPRVEVRARHIKRGVRGAELGGAKLGTTPPSPFLAVLAPITYLDRNSEFGHPLNQHSFMDVWQVVSYLQKSP